MEIRAEALADQPAVFALHQGAFGGDGEAKLVDLLRAQASPLVSLVAEEQGQILGHILFSPMSLPQDSRTHVMGLAPMAVLPEWQRKGIGSALVRSGLEKCRELGVSAIFVLGHAEYYPKFGFAPASRYGVRSEYAAPDECFMALELEPGALQGVLGLVKYHPAFASLA